MIEPVVVANSLTYTYPARRSQPERQALRGISFEVSAGALFGVLGPNGGGKSTLFQILSSALPMQGGTLHIGGYDLRTQAAEIRKGLGVLFQFPSLDVKLTVRENLITYGRLFGIASAKLEKEARALLSIFNLADRSDHWVETLSGGLRRRVELAKCLLVSPKWVLLDEPTTGLDPVARRDFWNSLDVFRKEKGLTVLATTHDMAEAARCDSLVLLDQGQLVAGGTPSDLTRRIGGDVLSIQTSQPDALMAYLASQFSIKATRMNGTVRAEHARAAELIAPLAQKSPAPILSITVSKPTLEDVFIQATGRAWEAS